MRQDTFSHTTPFQNTHNVFCDATRRVQLTTHNYYLYTCEDIMDAEQFNQFMLGISTLVDKISQAREQPVTVEAGTPSVVTSPVSIPRISVKLPVYKGEPKENILVWLLQIQNVLETQGITADEAKIQYAATALEDGALQWYLNKIKATQGQTLYSS